MKLVATESRTRDFEAPPKGYMTTFWGRLAFGGRCVMMRAEVPMHRCFLFPSAVSLVPDNGIPFSEEPREGVLSIRLIQATKHSRQGQLSEDEGEHYTPMGYGAKENEDVPDGMIVRPTVVSKKVCAGRVEQSLCQQKPQGKGREEGEHRLADKQDAPPHDKIDGQREARPATYGKDLVECTANDESPLYAEKQPTYPSTHYSHKDWGV